jgi:ABC-type branched-subunit amino acid transport system ATPase component
MPTPYSQVFDSFLSKIEDSYYASLTDTEIEIDLTKILNSSLIHFTYPKVNIFLKDDTTKTFQLDIPYQEVEIISRCMVKEWISRQTKSINLIKQALTDREFKMTSQANHLLALLELQKENNEELETLFTKYSYTSDLKANYDGLAGD